MRKEIFAAFIAALMLLAATPLKLMAERAESGTRTEYSGSCGSGVTWYLDTDVGALEISGSGSIKNYSSSSSQQAPWHRYAGSIKSIVINEGVAGIGSYAFDDCYAALSVSLPESLTSIGSQAFRRCNRLASVIIPDAVETIGDNAFSSCGSLSSVSIGSGVAELSFRNVFNSCTSLASITVSEGNPSYSSIDGVVFSKDRTELIYCPQGAAGAYTVPDGVTAIRSLAFYINKSLTSITVPDSVASISGNAFYMCAELTFVTIGSGYTASADSFNSIFYLCPKLTEVIVSEDNSSFRSFDGAVLSKDGTEFLFCPAGKEGTFCIPEGVTEIGAHAFASCSRLTGIVIPEGVTSIGSWAIEHCDSLVSIVLPDSLTCINYIFYDCASLTSVTLGSGFVELYDNYSLFEGCSNLANVYVSEQNPAFTSIDGVLFSKDGSELKYMPCGRTGTYNIPEGTVSIFDTAFYHSRLSRITIPESVVNIGRSVIADSNINALYIPSTVNNIGDSAFEFTSMQNVIIADGIESIGGAAFHLARLTSVTIPASVTSLGYNAFSLEDLLQYALFLGAPPQYCPHEVFEGSAEGFFIYYTPAYAELWSPNGETEWNGWPIRLITMDYPNWEEPVYYNDHDLIKLLYFLEQPSAVEGKKNGELLSENYDPAFPATFAERFDEAESFGASFIWQKDESGKKRLVSVDIRNMSGLAGGLDLSGCEKLAGLSLYGCGNITDIDVSGCSSLQTLYCRDCGTEAIDASGCASLWMVNAGALRSIALSGCAVCCEGVSAQGGGFIDVMLGGGDVLTAVEAEGAEFTGWFNGVGELISEAFALDITGSEGGYYAAVFGGAAPVPGDMDGDGALTFNDISSLYIALISSEDASIANGDVNGDGQVNFADVAALCLALTA